MKRWAWLLLAVQAFGYTGEFPFWTPYREGHPMHLWMTVYGTPIGERVDWATAPHRIDFVEAPDEMLVCLVPSPCVTLGELRAWAVARGK